MNVAPCSVETVHRADEDDHDARTTRCPKRIRSTTPKASAVERM